MSYQMYKKVESVQEVVALKAAAELLGAFNVRVEAGRYRWEDMGGNTLMGDCDVVALRPNGKTITVKADGMTFRVRSRPMDADAKPLFILHFILP